MRNNRSILRLTKGKQNLLCVALLVLLSSLALYALCGPEPERGALPGKVLFVGNSYTYFHELALVVSAMAQADSNDLLCDMSVAGGTTLEDHLKGERKLNTLKMIKAAKYDAVVLQDQSLRPIRDPDSTVRDVGLLCESIRKAKATPYLFLTWARRGQPEMQDLLTWTYMRAARKHGAKVVPVGMAWQRALKERPDIPLHDEDGSHPSQLGTYLSACVFFAALTGRSPIGLPNELIAKDASGGLVGLLRVSEEDATFCQQVAEKTWKAFASKHRTTGSGL